MSSGRVTRSQTGKTPRKSIPQDFVETPGPRRRTRRSASPKDDDLSDPSSAPTNGHVVKAKPARKAPAAEAIDPAQGGYEFGGPIGVTLIMLGYPLLMYYMFLGASVYGGGVPTPAPGEAVTDFVRRLAGLAYEHAFPSADAWAIYWLFLVFEGVCYIFMPGVWAKGKPLEHEGGRQLPYYCSGVASLYVTVVAALVLHFTGLFRLPILIERFGPIMSVAILSGFLVAIVAYVSAWVRGATHRMTGNHIYDFFMGAELNPRLFGILDFKMFLEVRLPWYMLFLTSIALCLKQYEEYGYVSGEAGFLLMAHLLYANACAKGEELIVTTWDMYFEKWGFMLIFWNMAGVPLSYCHADLYLAYHDPSEYLSHKIFPDPTVRTVAFIALAVVYLFVYWVWDTANSQKNMFRSRERGTQVERKSFPQLPWKEVKNPRVIETGQGDRLLVSGWYGLARKVNYSCDLFFALTWGLVTGFSSPYPWFYPVFFACMIVHRAHRDITKCRLKYGEAWTEYEKLVPALFIPYLF